MQCTLFTFCAKPQPGPVRRADIGKIESLPLLLGGSRSPHRLFVADLCMVVAHLRVLLHAERVLLIAPNRQTGLVDGNHAVAGGALEDMQLAHGGLRGGDHFELGETHLEHHVARQGHLLAHHNEGAGGGPDVAQVEIR